MSIDLNNDYILISRNGSVYKAKTSALSSVICFRSLSASIEQTYNEVSAYIEDSYNVFGDSHYTKNEMKSEFCTISSINNLTANETYVLKTKATAELNNLKTKSQVDTWKNDTVKSCAGIFIDEFKNIDDIMTCKVKPAEDYAKPPKESTLTDL